MPAPQIQTVPTEYKPWGLTAGAMVGQQQYDTEAANLQALNEARLANVGHERDAMLAQGQMDNPAWLQSKIAGDIGQGQTLAAQGEYDKGTLQSKLAAGIAKNLEGISESKVKQQLSEATGQLNTLKLASIYLDGPNGQNPAAITGVLQKYGEQMGFPKEVHQQLLQAEEQKPGTIKQAISALIPHLQEAISITPTVYADMAKKRDELKTAEDLTHSKDRAERLEATKYTADMHYKAMMAQIAAHKETAMKTMNMDQIAALMFKRASEATDPVEQQAWMDSYKIAIGDIKANKEAPAKVKADADAASQAAFLNRGKPGTGGKPLGDGTITTPGGNKVKRAD